MFKVPENLESKYRFVTLSALRAEQLQIGAQPRVPQPSHKHTVAAQEEVAAGLVEAWDPEEAEAMTQEEVAESEGEE
jgi:DNA-directed RNA polymerase omega subunit